MTVAKAARSPRRSCSIRVWSIDNNKIGVRSGGRVSGGESCRASHVTDFDTPKSTCSCRWRQDPGNGQLIVDNEEGCAFVDPTKLFGVSGGNIWGWWALDRLGGLVGWTCADSADD